jgi:hypothetical protein
LRRRHTVVTDAAEDGGMERTIHLKLSSRMPEDSEAPRAIIGFDTRDPDSLRRARATLREQFGLVRVPPLCAPARPTLRRRIVAFLRRWLAR